MSKSSYALIVVTAAALTLTGCNRENAAPAAPSNADATQSDAVVDDAFAGCQKGKVTGSHISIMSYACGPDQHNQKLAAADEVGGFAIVSDGSEPQVVVRTFAKAANAPIEGALAAIRAASPGPSTATCVLSPSTVDGLGTVYELSPTGAAKTRWDAAEANPPGSGDEGDGTPPCGDLGVGYAGERYFQVLNGDPTRVVYFDMGSEIQIFDPKTLKAE